MANDEQIRVENAVGDGIMSIEAVNKFRKKLEISLELGINNNHNNNNNNEVTIMKQAECECCGLKEECTEGYITQIERSHSGKWVCGLCSEAVKETIERCPETAMDEAVSFHRDFCNKYNTTTRLNPKLSFTCHMRDIAKRSCQSRSSTNNKNLANINSKLARSSSCVPRIDLEQY